MEEIKKGSDEWKVIAATILHFVESNITKGGVAYIPETGTTLTTEEAYDAIVELLSKGLLVLCSPDNSGTIMLVSAAKLGQKPQPKPLFKKSFHGTYELLQSYCKKGGGNGTN